MLRIKIKSLAEEAKLIRREERRTFGQLRNELHLHRTGIVRYEARHTHIAYGLLRGRSIDQIEPRAKEPPNMGKVEAMLKKYGSVA